MSSIIAFHRGHPNFELVRADVVEPFMVEVDEVNSPDLFTHKSTADRAPDPPDLPSRLSGFPKSVSLA